MTNNKKEKIFNLIWSVFAKLFSGLKLALLSIIVARSLGPNDFGVFSYVISLVTLFSTLAEFRLQSVLIRDFSTNKVQPEVLLGSSLKVCAIFSFVGYLLLSCTVFLLNDNQLTKYFILIYGASYIFQVFRFIRAYFISNYLNSIILKLELFTASIVITIAFLLSYFELSISYFFALRILDVFIFSALLVLIYQLKNGSLLLWKSNKSVMSKLVKDSLPLVLSGIAVTLFNKIDQIMLKHFIDDYAVGQYSAAVSIIGIISFVPVVLSESVVPILMSKKNHSDKLYGEYLQSFSNILTWGSVIISLILMLASPMIITLIYGEEYHPAISIMKIFSIKGVFVAMGAVSAQIMIIDSVHQLAYLKSIAGGVVNIVLNYILISEMGMKGAVWSSLIAFFLSSYLMHFFIPRYRYIFRIQSNSLISGWLRVSKDVKKIINKNTE